MTEAKAILQSANDIQCETKELMQTIVEKHNEQSNAMAQLDANLTGQVESVNNQLQAQGLALQISKSSPFGGNR